MKPFELKLLADWPFDIKMDGNFTGSSRNVPLVSLNYRLRGEIDRISLQIDEFAVDVDEMFHQFQFKVECNGISQRNGWKLPQNKPINGDRIDLKSISS